MEPGPQGVGSAEKNINVSESRRITRPVLKRDEALLPILIRVPIERETEEGVEIEEEEKDFGVLRIRKLENGKALSVQIIRERRATPEEKVPTDFLLRRRIVSRIFKEVIEAIGTEPFETWLVGAQKIVGKWLQERANEKKDEEEKKKEELERVLKDPNWTPPCVRSALETPTKDACELCVSWLKKKGFIEKHITNFIKTFMKRHEIEFSATDLFELMDVEPFTCEVGKDLGFCDEENCLFRLSPVERLVNDTESVLLFVSTAELDVRVAGKREVIKIDKLYVRIKDKEGNEVIAPNVDLLFKIYLRVYHRPPDAPIRKEDAERLIRFWIETAEKVKEAVDPDLAIEEAVVGLFIEEAKPFYTVELLKKGAVTAQAGFFVEDGTILVESSLLRTLLEARGIRERREKVGRAVRRLLATPGRASKLVRLPDGTRRYFWVFSVEAIRKLAKRDGIDWIPKVRKEPVIADVSSALCSIIKELKEDNQGDGEQNPPVEVEEEFGLDGGTER